MKARGRPEPIAIMGRISSLWRSMRVFHLAVVPGLLVLFLAGCSHKQEVAYALASSASGDFGDCAGSGCVCALDAGASSDVAHGR